MLSNLDQTQIKGFAYGDLLIRKDRPTLGDSFALIASVFGFFDMLLKGYPHVGLIGLTDEVGPDKLKYFRRMACRCLPHPILILISTLTVSMVVMGAVSTQFIFYPIHQWFIRVGYGQTELIYSRLVSWFWWESGDMNTPLSINNPGEISPLSGRQDHRIDAFLAIMKRHYRVLLRLCGALASTASNSGSLFYYTPCIAHRVL